MLLRAIALFLAAADTVPTPGRMAPQADVVAHEWGTFTSVAGRDGSPIGFDFCLEKGCASRCRIELSSLRKPWL